MSRATTTVIFGHWNLAQEGADRAAGAHSEARNSQQLLLSASFPLLLLYILSRAIELPSKTTTTTTTTTPTSSRPRDWCALSAPVAETETATTTTHRVASFRLEAGCGSTSCHERQQADHAPLRRFELPLCRWLLALSNFLSPIYVRFVRFLVRSPPLFSRRPAAHHKLSLL